MPKTNPGKNQKLRPVRVLVVGLIMFLAILFLYDLPDSDITEKTDLAVNNDSSESSTVAEEAVFLHLAGLLDILEERMETRLLSLGVPKEELSHPEEYLDKNELYALETKATLASKLEENLVLATQVDLEKIRDIFSLDADFSFAQLRTLNDPPVEYKNLADLIAEYDRSLAITEDYDLKEEVSVSSI